MKICTWNCNGAFRKKVEAIMDTKADIYIIQECENPYMMETQSFENNFLWTGASRKGLGIFAKKGIILKALNWNEFGLEWFIPCTINNKILLIGIWGCRNYIEDINLYLKINADKISKFKNIIIAGDFNSNSVWDKKHIRRSHTDAVKLLESLGLCSCYHFAMNEMQGNESIPTFYMHRKKDKPYHIDYIFADQLRFNAINVGTYEEWIRYSDHMPIIIDINYKDEINENIRN